jgi:hypothetical protein
MVMHVPDIGTNNFASRWICSSTCYVIIFILNAYLDEHNETCGVYVITIDCCDWVIWKAFITACTWGGSCLHEAGQRCRISILPYEYKIYLFCMLLLFVQCD